MNQIMKKAVYRFLIHILGRTNLVRLARYLGNEARLDGTNDPLVNGELLVQSCILGFLQAEGIREVCVFDVGANIGEWSKSLLEQRGRCTASIKIHAFEPFSGTFQTLERNLSEWGFTNFFKTNCVALSSTRGKKTFYATGDNIGTNGFYAIEFGAKARAQVVTETVDSYCADEGISRIHLLKIDTEGHDMEVLTGCKKMLAGGHIDAVQFEYNYRWIFARHFLRDAFSFALDFDLAIGKITRDGIEFYPKWHFELETFREGNYLLVREDLRDIFPAITWWNQNSIDIKQCK